VSRYTIRDVAKEAGVGIGTVSRVLNNSPLVSEETRKKVLIAIDRLDFHPSSVARRLSTGGRALSIGIVVPFFTRPVFVGRLQGIEATLAQSEYDLILYNVETTEQRDDLLRYIPEERRVDGLIIISLCPADKDIASLRRAKIPVVLLDAWHPDITSIRINDEDGGRQVTRHLISLGHERIAYISDRVDSGFRFRASAQRLKGYRAVMNENGLPVRPEYLRQGEHGRHIAHRLTQELLALDDPPTAIFAASDTQALGALEAAREAGLRVPQDLSIVGYDDIEVAAYVGLTTVHQPMYQLGVEGVRELMRHLNDENRMPETRTLPVSLIIRETTAPPPGAV